MYLRKDLKIIANMISEKSRVLDIGCGDGELLYYLGKFKKVDGRGIEISKDGINKCFKSGLSVVQGDIVAGLDYPKKSFDFVILSQTIQTISSPTTALTEMLRVGKMAIVSFPNFGHWLVRLSFLSRGSMPMTKSLPYKWYNTPNVHLCTIQDFVNLCKDLKISINQIYILGELGKFYERKLPLGLSNLFGKQAVFLLSK
jgi:methionine biosynthesis protein MetW|tara:strand:+ start:518 stop:1117 length:600 start_codon:yes stop_codon:yes gene_type:complete